MSIFDETGISPDSDENSFTKEDAAKAFQAAADKVKNADGEFLKELLKGGLDVLRLIASFTGGTST
jgi:hypothetical protein